MREETHVCVARRRGRLPPSKALRIYGEHCGDAWRKVSVTQGCGIYHERDSVHFNVDSFLQSTTGLDLEHLLGVVKERHSKNG